MIKNPIVDGRAAIATDKGRAGFTPEVRVNSLVTSLRIASFSISSSFFLLLLVTILVLVRPHITVVSSHN